MWADLVSLIEPFAPVGNTGRPPFPLSTMLRIHFMQQWFGLSDPAMEEALHDIPLYREFAKLSLGITRLPDGSTILAIYASTRDLVGVVQTNLKQSFVELVLGKKN